ncbi:Hypothetical_protein [Hexamita inflata]|uniref:Hypothetical_protein n=1 Tax=Hexamita inflata TaxID=28002 RepID=A0ABP1IJV2_9EUKA
MGNWWLYKSCNANLYIFNANSEYQIFALKSIRFPCARTHILNGKWAYCNFSFRGVEQNLNGINQFQVLGEIKLLNQKSLYYITSNADHHPCSLTDPLAFFKKQAEGLQLRANLVDFGLYLASDLVFCFSYRPLFLKYSQNINKFLNFCYFYVYNDLNSIIYCRLLSFLVYIWLKSRLNQYYLINQISKHFSYRPQIQFSYKPFYQQKSKGSVTEHFWVCK